MRRMERIMWRLLEMYWVSCVAAMILQVVEFLCYVFFSRKLIGGGSLAGFLLLGMSGVCLVNEVAYGAAVVVVEGGGEWFCALFLRH